MLTLELRNLSAGYSSDAVLHGVDIEIHRGEIVTLIGTNGAGKSALVNAISGIIPSLPFRSDTSVSALRIRTPVAEASIWPPAFRVASCDERSDGRHGVLHAGNVCANP